MKKKKVESDPKSDLRRQAEERLRDVQNGPVGSKIADDVDAMALVHELQVHQIELEMQNEELVQAKLGTEDALAKYSNLYNFAPIGLFTLDTQGLVQEVNLMGAALLGIERRNLMNRSFRQFVAPKDRPYFDDFLKSMFNATIKKFCELRLLRDGEPTIYARIEAVAAEDALQNSRLCRISTIDITDLKRAMTDAEILARFPKENPNPVIRISTEGTIIFANPSSDRLLKKWGCEVGGMLPEDYRNLVRDAFRSGNRIEAEAASDDTIYSLIFAPILDMGYVNIYGRDITRRKLAEKALIERAEELAKKTEDLTRSNAELEQFAYVASHDLQEPLRIVTSYAQHLEKRYKGKLDHEADEFIGFITDGTKRMERLIKGLLAYSRVGTRGKPFERIETEEVLKEALQNLKLAIEDSKGKVTHDPLPVIVADESQMVELFQNLIGNGLKFHGDDSPIVHITARRDGRGWIFSLKDNGIGIDPQHYAKLFIIFQRLNPRDFPGTGIGLAISKKIVERHGGRIWVDSAPGEGSTFYFSIPDRDESAADGPIENSTN